MHFRSVIGILSMGLLMTSLTSGNLKGADPAPTNGEKTAEERAPSDSPAPQEAALPLAEIEKAYRGSTPPEAVRMLLAIARGSNVGPGEGWFGPAATRYSWKWLAKRHGISESETIPADKSLGTAAWFARLDRNRDGQIAAEDLDWSDRNPWVQQAYLVNRIFRRIETTGDGKLTREEWLAFFDNAAQGKDHLQSEDLLDAVLGGNTRSFLPGDAPSQDVLIRGLFAGDIGSLYEGPRLDARAPDFSLTTHDGKNTVRLSDLLGEKPVVLTFGNFTCGPFRSMFPAVGDVHKRFAEEAAFVAIYVREAHPTDGWKMESNDRVGVAVEQPKTYGERAEVATQCHRLLKPAMPLLIDEINDAVGNMYSGMPARLYVIDREGRVAYKSGRGPFGFKAGEMEQALVMTLLDQSAKRPPETAADTESSPARP